MRPACLSISDAGYGLALLVVFVLSTVMLGSSFQMMSYQGSRAPMTASIDNLMARETATGAFEAVRADILSKLSAKTTVDTSYRYPSVGTNTISMPTDAASLGGSTGAVGTYYATITQARGNSYLVKVTATAGASTVSISRRIQIQSTCNPDTTFTGRASGDNAGYVLSSAGDVNGDGYADILIGAKLADGGGADSGEVYLIFGRGTTDWQSLTDANGNFDLNNTSTANNMVRFTGRHASDQAGFSVSSAGDVNNDGYADILIGARFAQGGGTASGSPNASGESYLILGRSTANWQALVDAGGNFSLSNTSDANLAFRFPGRAAGDEAGFSVSSAGDVNNDGYSDILLGSWTEDGIGTNSGAVYLILGRSTANWQALTPTANGDFSLSNSSDANTAFRFTARSGADRLGSAVSFAGDTNNDGYADILLGARTAQGGGTGSGSGSGAGEAYLILGRSTANWQALTPTANGDFSLSSTSDANTAFRFLGKDVSDNAGGALAAGDVNGDGYSDIVIGAFSADGGGASSGDAYLILGRSTANWQALTDASGDFSLTSTSDANNSVHFLGRNSNDHLGGALSVGDVDGDGYADIFMGADQATGGGANAGESYLVLGRTTANWQALTDASGNFDADNLSDANKTVRFIGQSAGDMNGHAVSAFGDFNGDGYFDLLIGSPATGNGEAYLTLGRKTASWQAFTDANGDYDLDNIYTSCSAN